MAFPPPATFPRYPVSSLGDRQCLRIGLACLLLIIYGSLVPLEFRPVPLEQAWARFLNVSYLQLGPQSRADWTANLLLYIPPAFFLSGWLAQRPGYGVPHILLTVLICTLVAVGIEFSQLYFPPRTVSLNDLLAEAIGTALGITLWHFAGRRLLGVWQAVRLGGPTAIRAALLLYALGYLVLSLFPFDFVVSFSELGDKLGGDTVQLFVAADSVLSIRSLAKLTAEVIAIMPLGALLGVLWGAERPNSRRRVVVTGLALGVAIELLQLLLVSGVSQGISVLTRPSGMVLGLWLLRRLQRRLPQPEAPHVKRGIALLLIPYLLLLTAVHNWFGQEWLPLGTALQKIGNIQWLPFFYHYYTTETRAMESLLRIAGIYGPVGVGLCFWRGLPKAPGATTWFPGLLAGALALVIEASKLFLPGKHPDPTNILIAAAAAMLAYAITAWIGRWARQPSPADAVAVPVSTETSGSHSAITGDPREQSASRPVPVGQYLLALPLLVIVLITLIRFPVASGWLAAGAMAYAALLWRYPASWLVAIPALLPVLDLTPWSGWLFFNAFDLLILLTVAVALLRYPLSVDRPVMQPGAVRLIRLIILVQLLSMLVGVLPLAPLDANAFSHYYSPYNSLRLAKGLCWALLLLLLLRREVRRGAPVVRLFTAGVLAGLSATVLVVVRERLQFPGVFDFDGDYRVTGLFSGMHTGDAYLDGYLMVALPFIAAGLLFWRTARGIAFATGLFALAMYALLVTFSRSNYLAFGLASLILVIGAARLIERARLKHLLIAGACMLLVTLAVAWPVLQGAYIQQRFATTEEAASTRLDHWRMALAMRDHGWASRLVGMGKGSFPRTWFWRNPQGERPMTYQYLDENGNRFLRLGSGQGMYLGQRIDLPRQASAYRLRVDLRSHQDNGNVQMPVALCEKSVQYSANCVWVTLPVQGKPGEWHHYQVDVDLAALGDGPWYARRPLDLALSNNNRSAVLDVDNLQLLTSDGRQLLDNGDFSTGGDHWFFASDPHLPWHIFNLWVHLLFEEGWLGVGVFTLLLGYLYTQLLRRIRAGDAFASILAASLTGFLAVGLFNTLLDDPRLILLFYLIAWLVMLKTDAGERIARQGVRPQRKG